MSKRYEKSLNKNVADFEYNGDKYQVDLLLDSISNGYQSYDIFKTTYDKKGLWFGGMTLEEGDYAPSELIEKVKNEFFN